MKTTLTKISLVICVFTVFSCKKADNTTNNGPANNHQTTNCQVASNIGGGVDNFLYYNSKYQVSACTTYDSTGKIAQDSMTFQYNSAGHLTGMSNYNPGSNAAQNTATFVYNSSGFLIQYNRFIGSATPDTFDNYTCDSKGNIIIDSNYDFTTGTPVLTEVTTFGYDANGNITTEKLYIMGALESTTTLTYDNYTSYMNNLPLAFRVLMSGPLFSNYNNILTYNVATNGFGSFSSTFSYTYNSEGLPVTATSKTAGFGTESVKITYDCH